MCDFYLAAAPSWRVQTHENRSNVQPHFRPLWWLYHRQVTVLRTDASGHRIGAILSENHAKHNQMIAYASRALYSAEKNYRITDRECLAVVWAVTKCRSYLFGRPSSVITNQHALLVDLEVWPLDSKGTISSSFTNPDSSTRTQSASTVTLWTRLTPSTLTMTFMFFLYQPSSTLATNSAKIEVCGQFLKMWPRAKLNPLVACTSSYTAFSADKNSQSAKLPSLLGIPKHKQIIFLADFHDASSSAYLGVRTYAWVKRRFY